MSLAILVERANSATASREGFPEERWTIQLPPAGSGARSIARALAWLLIHRCTGVRAWPQADRVEIRGGDVVYTQEDRENGVPEWCERLIDGELGRHMRRYGDWLVAARLPITETDRTLGLPGCERVLSLRPPPSA